METKHLIVPDHETAIRYLVARLDRERPSSPREAIEAEVRAEFERWRDARVQEFVPLLVERQLRHRLTSTGS